MSFPRTAFPQPSTATPASLGHGGLYLAYSETPRRELDGWADQLRVALAARDRWPGGSVAHATRTIGSTNAVALLEAHRGDLDAASRVCRAQLHWLARHPGRAQLGVARHAVNPWINLGRLAAMRGDTASALAHFARFGPGGNGRLLLGELRVPRRALNELLQNELAFRDFAAHVYVVDSLRALLRGGDAASLRAFLDDPATRRAAHRAGAGVELITAEARLLTTARDDDPGAVGDAARHWASRTTGAVRAVFLVRAADAERALASARARRLMPSLAAAIAAVDGLLDREVPTLLAIALAVHAARLSLAAGSRRAARRLARAALEAATARGDVPLQHASVAVLASLPGAGAGAAMRARDQLAASTAIRLVSGRVAPRSASLRALLAEAAAALDDATLGAD